MEVALGAGRDRLTTHGDGVTADSILDGGRGPDALVLDADGGGPDVDVHAGRRTIDRGGRVVSSWESFEWYGVRAFAAAVSFHGSARPERLFVAGGARRLDVHLGGGSDQLSMFPAEQGTANGGNGRDLIEFRGRGHVDLASHVISSGRGREIGIRSFQDVTTRSSRVTGDAQDNDIVIGCGMARGGAGDDRIRQSRRSRPPVPGRCTDFVAIGGPGDDRLVGSNGPDRLTGGTGYDVANGLRGRDDCDAERRIDC